MIEFDVYLYGHNHLSGRWATVPISRLDLPLGTSLTRVGLAKSVASEAAVG